VPGPGAAPYLANFGSSVGVNGGGLGITPSPATVREPVSGAPIAFSVEPGRHLLEFRGSGIYGPQHDESDRWLDFGIIVQTEYLYDSPSTGNGSPTEQLFFRRLRPTIMGGMGDWQGIIMLDFGAGADGTTYNTAVRWANLQYTGFYQAHATFGSFKPWFSRELLTEGPHLDTVERSPVGNTNFGNPDYMIGFSWDQMLPNRKLAYYLSAGLEDHPQSVTQMQMHSPAYVASGANQGWLVTARLDYYLLGEMPYDPRPLHTPPPSVYFQSDFHADSWRAVVSTAMYGWWNAGRQATGRGLGRPWDRRIFPQAVTLANESLHPTGHRYSVSRRRRESDQEARDVPTHPRRDTGLWAGAVSAARLPPRRPIQPKESMQAVGAW
jgi:hypothetical protein